MNSMTIAPLLYRRHMPYPLTHNPIAQCSHLSQNLPMIARLLIASRLFFLAKDIETRENLSDWATPLIKIMAETFSHTEPVVQHVQWLSHAHSDLSHQARYPYFSSLFIPQRLQVARGKTSYFMESMKAKKYSFITN